MTGDKVTRQRIRSDSSVDSADHQTPESIKLESRAKSRRQGNYIEKRQLEATSIGKAAWDKIFTGENFDIPSTRFMVGLEQGRKINMVSMFRVFDLELVVSIYNP